MFFKPNAEFWLNPRDYQREKKCRKIMTKVFKLIIINKLSALKKKERKKADMVLEF